MDPIGGKMKVALCLFGNVGIRKNSGHRPLSSDVTKESEAASTNPENCL